MIISQDYLIHILHKLCKHLSKSINDKIKILNILKKSKLI